MLFSEEIFKSKKMFTGIQDLMREADESILKIYYQNNFKKKMKNDKSPVTEADLISHKIIVSRLGDLTPTIPVVSEEDTESYCLPRTNSTYWLIDPLDGTKEFIKHTGEFTCNVALIENQQPIIGFVTIPAKNEFYFGGKSFGAFLKKPDKQLCQIKTSKMKDVTRIIASKSHLNEETKVFIKKQPGKVELVRAGSSLKFLKIALGQADIYPRLGPTCEWDTAAAQAILEGAGGKVLQAYNKRPLVYGKNNIINPYFIASV